MPEPLPNVRLQLLNTPENVVLVREMLTGVAEAAGIGESDLNDIRTAVTEACNNVVLHAYGGDRGPMDIDVLLASESIGVLVRDRGSGIRDWYKDEQGFGAYAEESIGSDTEVDLSSAGIGLHVIETLAHEAHFKRSEGGGTEVRMRFSVPTDALGPGTQELALASLTGARTVSTATLSIAPLALAHTILPRLVSSLAARAHFSTDRISDAQLLADALAAHTAEALDSDRLNVEINAGQREIELHLAPLLSGSAQRLLEDSTLDGLGSVIEKLTDSRRVATLGSYERLTLGLLDSR
jgi:serine/threonine-protein kinase RsbW